MSNIKLCCGSCFGDRGLQKQIIPIHSKKVGVCSYCSEQNVDVIPPDVLCNYFELLVGIYSPSSTEGKSLVEWFQEDWELFTHHKMDHAHSKELLGDILNDGEIVRKHFVPAKTPNSHRLDTWTKFKEELMYKNRFFPDIDIDKDRLRNLLSHLIIDPHEIKTTWFRARINKPESNFSFTDMGAPPNDLATAGRANPSGIPYLYLASTKETSVSEIRPQTGEKVCVADFKINSNLKVIDLKSPKSTISPFLLDNENEVALLRNDIEFLVQLGSELTRPVLKHVAAIEYLPSQYICELIKKCGYHGVIYKSAIEGGTNLALFNRLDASVKAIENYQIGKVSIELNTT